jgi:hypothetical protein
MTGEERPLAEFGDPQLDVAALGAQQSFPRTIAFGNPILGALIAPGADPLGRLGFDQFLHHDPYRIANKIHAITGTERLEQFRHGRLG